MANEKEDLREGAKEELLKAIAEQCRRFVVPKLEDIGSASSAIGVNEKVASSIRDLAQAFALVNSGGYGAKS